jgi:hypothetical protein
MPLNNSKINFQHLMLFLAQLLQEKEPKILLDVVQMASDAVSEMAAYASRE